MAITKVRIKTTGIHEPFRGTEGGYTRRRKGAVRIGSDPPSPPLGVKTARKPLIVKRLGGKVYSRNEAKIACNALIPGNLDGEIVHSKELSS